MRVLHFSDTLLGKTETFVQARLRDWRFESVAVTWEHVTDGLPVPCPFIVLDRYEARGPNRGIRRLVRGPLRVAGRNGSILKALVGARPDVGHAHFGTVGSGTAPYCRLLGIPLVVSFYGFDLALPPDNIKMRAAYARMFRYAAAFTAEGPTLAKRLIDLGAPPARVRLLPLGLPEWAMRTPPPRPPRAPGTLRLFQVARFVEKKGIDLTLRAIAEARHRGIDARLVLAGGGPLETELRALAMELRLEDAVRFIGYVAHDALANHLGAADALIQPSRTSATGDTEGGHPTILIEALAQSVPILATRHADIPFVVRSGENGLLSDENDVGGLVNNVRRAAEEPGLLEALSGRARRSVLRRHDPDVLLRLKERIYREAIRSTPTSRSRQFWRAFPLPDPFYPPAQGSAR